MKIEIKNIIKLHKMVWWCGIQYKKRQKELIKNEVQKQTEVYNNLVLGKVEFQIRSQIIIIQQMLRG